MSSTSLDDLYFRAAGPDNKPFHFQRQFAEDDDLPGLVNVPTGCGKTAMAILGWLWRRRFADTPTRDRTPRRLVYCLPMRVLVEQTRDNAVKWLHRLCLLGGSAEFEQADGKDRLVSYMPSWADPSKIVVSVLMGGEETWDWDIYPERDAILIGTQDMLLSRALNRGYAASRSRWPLQFGLLHTDCLWVFDEIQLMGSGLATTAQLEAFRRLLPNKDDDQAKNGHACRSVWMSATLQKDWLNTVDFAPHLADLRKLELTKADFSSKEVNKRWKACKPLKRAGAKIGDATALAGEILREHKARARTIVVVNTVARACQLYNALMAAGKGRKGRRRKAAKERAVKDTGATTASSPQPRIVLLHSRFRPPDRQRAVNEALAEPLAEGTVVVSTQVIEAGVDVSATIMFTELAPWASLVQRFGRCNRKGEASGHAAVRWIDLPSKKPEELARPYAVDDLISARDPLEALTDVGLESLPPVPLPFEHDHVIRRKDLIDLFDTTPDLAGNDIDIDRFVREIDGSDVRVFWREFEGSPNDADSREGQAAPRREELCTAPVGEFREFVKTSAGKVWRWSFLDRKGEPAKPGAIAPGQTYLIHLHAGGYSPASGWTGDHKDKPTLDVMQARGQTPDGTDADASSATGVWQTIAQHTDEGCKELDFILAAIPAAKGVAEALRHAVRWHDRGKAHEQFQMKIDDGQELARKDRDGEPIVRRQRPDEWRGCRVVAKAPGEEKDRDGRITEPGFWRTITAADGGRRSFRHELASALAVLDPKNKGVLDKPDELRDLIAYLVAAHHGKVRLSIRSLPNEMRPNPRQDDRGRERRFARGVWDADALPQTDLGGGVIAPAVTLSLEPMELGLCEQEPFIDLPSWAERMIGLRDTLGPFHLAFLEAILRAADIRASKGIGQHAATQPEAGND